MKNKVIKVGKTPDFWIMKGRQILIWDFYIFFNFFFNFFLFFFLIFIFFFLQCRAEYIIGIENSLEKRVFNLVGFFFAEFFYLKENKLKIIK